MLDQRSVTTIYLQEAKKRQTLLFVIVHSEFNVRMIVRADVIMFNSFVDNTLTRAMSCH